MALRRGKARSVRELGEQVAARRRIQEQIDALDIEKKESSARIESEKRKLQKKLEPLDRNIERFYYEDGERHFKKRTKTIFTVFGLVGSKASKKLKFNEPLDVVIDNIIKSGRVREFLSVQLKEGALKKAPTFAKSAGVEVEEGEIIVISPPTTNQN